MKYCGSGADDLERHLPLRAEVDDLAERIRARELAAHERFVDDDDARPAGAVRLREIAAGENAGADGRQIVAADDADVGRLAEHRLDAVAARRQRDRVLQIHERQLTGIRSRLNAGRRTQPRDQRLGEFTLTVRGLHPGSGDLKRQHM
jgi:hypothetical protein